MPTTTHESRDGEAELDGPDPKKPFYIICMKNLDGSLDLSSEGKDHFTLDAAIEQATGYAYSGGEVFVVECRAIRRASRSPVRINTLKPGHADK